MTTPRKLAVTAATIAALSVVAFILGYVFGGLVYSTEGDDFLSSPATVVKAYQELVGAIIASVVAILAAWIAWHAVQRQIAATANERVFTERRALVAKANAISIMLNMAAAVTRRRPINLIDHHAIALCAQSIEQAMQMDVRLGVTLAAWTTEAGRMNGQLLPFSGEGQIPASEPIDLFSGRTELLSRAFSAASVAMELHGNVAPTALVTLEDLAACRFAKDPNDYPLGWVGPVARSVHRSFGPAL